MNTQTLQRKYSSTSIVVNYQSDHPQIYAKRSYWCCTSQWNLSPVVKN